MTTRLASACVLVLTFGCHRPANPYPADVVENFLRACTARTRSEAACRCTLGKLQDRYTLDQYRALEARVARGEVPPELADIAAACR